ncbi:MAG TPA: hypothetical protein VF678_00160 [bacterium]
MALPLRPTGLVRSLLWLASGLALLALPAAAQSPTPPNPQAATPQARAPRQPPPTFGFGERATVRNCLRFMVSDYRDRQADVENHDWVKVRVENACRSTLRNVLMELMLVDAQGKRYGTPVWVVGQGEQLQPGDAWEDDIAVPDPDSRVAKRWSITVLRADGLPKPPRPPGEKGEQDDKGQQKARRK